MAKYDYVAILCASPADETGHFVEVTDSGLYLGGQHRMNAAARALLDGVADKAIIVGGGLAEPDPAERQRKVRDMWRFLVDVGVPKAAITGVISDADTLGNMRALYVTHGPQLAGKTVGIFTNDYHLPRAMRIVEDQQFSWEDVTFIPVAAETHLPIDLNDLTSEMQRRQALEAQGLADLEAGTYRNQQADPATWRGELYVGE